MRRFWILALFVLVVASIGGYIAGTSQAFFPRSVAVRGNHVVSRDEIAQKAAIARNRNVWLQNTRAMAKRVETIPFIATAKIRRALDADVTIEVTERVPFATVRTLDEEATVDRDLRVLGAGADEAAPALPLLIVRNHISLVPGRFLKDETLSRLRGDDVALVAAHIPAVVLSTDRYGQLVATLRNGVRLLLGDDDDLARKLPLVDPILTQLARAHRPIAALDLRAPTTPIVVYKK
ncbi:MAG: FtsQ-type POTRA domain-containing protein [Candidatus Eremiobacteraeota bacterium]|nr:FtsQ-type POTRA domain-containing protein [Candidatus Eremiobacteraeota bacterium]